MIRRRSHPDATVSTRRLEAYTDGVFAIAATLLVLDLTARSVGHVGSDAEMWAALGDMVSPLVAFAVSFVLLGMMWLTHVGQFEHIARIDAMGIWINTVRLLFIVLVPFTTSLVADYSEYLAGRVLLPLNFFIVILISWTQWVWAMRRHGETMPGLSFADARAQGRGSLAALILAAAALALSVFIGSFGFLVFLLDGILTKALGGNPPADTSPDGTTTSPSAGTSPSGAPSPSGT